MKSKLGDKARLQHISDAIKEIEKYIANSSYGDFQSNSSYSANYICGVL